MSFGISSFVYNMRTKTISLQGPAKAAKDAKVQLQAGLEIFKRSGSLNDLQSKLDQLRQSIPMNDSQGCGRSSSANMFALRGQQDSATVAKWTKSVLPHLLLILDRIIGRDYSVHLVRQGSSETSARLCIRIQSPRKLLEATQKNIQQTLDEMCETNMGRKIRVHYSTGYLALLATPNPQNNVCSESKEEDNYSAEEDNEKTQNEKTRMFFYHRFWQNPGMGASIGMYCTKYVPATLGGYILVDNKKLMLTVNHFIKSSIDTIDKNDNSAAAISHRTLTSPSLFHVLEMQEKLLANLQSLMRDQTELIARSSDNPEINVDDQNLDPKWQRILDEKDFLDDLYKEVDQPDKNFIVGKLAFHCRLQPVLPITSEPLAKIESDMFETRYQMDWALFEISDSRMGENQHRYQSESFIEEAELNPEATVRATGDENLCKDTCDPEPNASIYYVGQASGRREGQILGQVLIVRGGIKYYEWALQPQNAASSKHCEGDSGA